MPQTAADKVQDDLIEHEVRLARVGAGLQRKIDDRLDQLGRDLAELTMEVDANGAQRADARIRRLKRLDKESRELIRVAYSDINVMTRAALINVADASSTNLATSLENNIP